MRKRADMSMLWVGHGKYGTEEECRCLCGTDLCRDDMTTEGNSNDDVRKGVAVHEDRRGGYGTGSVDRGYQMNSHVRH